MLAKVDIICVEEDTHPPEPDVSSYEWITVNPFLFPVFTTLSSTQKVLSSI